MAKRDVAGIVAGAGLLAGIFTEFAQAVYDRGGTTEDIHRLATPEGRVIIGQWADLTVSKPTACNALSQRAGLTVSKPLACNAFNLSVDYSRSLVEVVLAGNYRDVNPKITDENFPTDKGDPEVIGNPAGVQVVEAVLVYADRLIESDEVLGELERMGLRPGTMFELAHFGEQHPHIQREFPIVALASVWTDPSDSLGSVGCLWTSDGAGYLWNPDSKAGVLRNLHLRWINYGGWDADYAFLAFRK